MDNAKHCSADRPGNIDIPALMFPQVNPHNALPRSIYSHTNLICLEGSHMKMVWSLQLLCHLTEIIAIYCEQLSGIRRLIKLKSK